MIILKMSGDGLCKTPGEKCENKERVSLFLQAVWVVSKPEKLMQLSSVMRRGGRRWPVFSGVQMLQGRKNITLLSAKGFEILCA